MENKDILIVDDDENMNFALCETLKRKNYLVDNALSYLDAKSKISFNNYPMVITDVRMPDGNGIDLVREIKEKNPETRIIVITAYGKIEDAVTALKTGADDYILKPFEDLEDLLDMINCATKRINRWEKSVKGTFKLKT